MKSILFFISFSFVSFSVLAQQVDEGDLFLLKGQIVNMENNEPLPLVTVYNKGMQQGVTSNSSGFFSINYHSGDSIIFQSMGFENLVWIDAKNSFYQKEVTIKMQPKTYELKPVDVIAFKTAEDFKRHILAMDMPEEKPLEIPGLEMVKAEPSGEGKMVISGPVSFLYDKFSRSSKNKRNFLLTKAAYEKQQVISLKYSEIVKKIIKVEDPEALEEFMGFCKLNDAFIESASEYELIVAINKCYDEFKVLKDSLN